MLKAGLIGLGRVSTFYVDALRVSRRLELRAVCDTNPVALEPFRQEGIPAYRDVASLLSDADVDAVIVDTPVPTHVEISAAALEAGKHVCCEKPLALTKVDALRLLDLATTQRRTMFTAFHRRYNRNLPDPGVIDLHGIDRIEVGYLQRIEDHAGRGTWHLAPAEDGGGVIVDNGPNSFAVVRHLFGDLSATSVEVERSPAGVDFAAVVRGQLDRTNEVVFLLDWGFEGERKDVILRYKDGAERRFDMLSGFPAFKSSLYHEYEALLDHFADLTETGGVDAMGYECTAWLEDVLTLSAHSR